MDGILVDLVCGGEILYEIDKARLFLVLLFMNAFQGR